MMYFKKMGMARKRTRKKNYGWDIVSGVEMAGPLVEREACRREHPLDGFTRQP